MNWNEWLGRTGHGLVNMGMIYSKNSKNLTYLQCSPNNSRRNPKSEQSRSLKNRESCKTNLQQRRNEVRRKALPLQLRSQLPQLSFLCHLTLPHQSQLPLSTIIIMQHLNTMQPHSTLPTILTPSCNIHMPCACHPHFTVIYTLRHKLQCKTHLLRRTLHRRTRICPHHRLRVLKTQAILRSYSLSVTKFIF